ncbi:NAD(P)-binding protein [Xylariaceae sp. FL1019]|nr:NAD(P)-binding protein [Xylariaceae sp. FL1019]
MASFLITGTSRGLGLALVQELSSRPESEVSRIFAAVRGDSSSLDDVVKKSAGRVSVLKLDVTSKESIKAAAVEVEKQLGDKGLDVLINNAGVCHYEFDGVKSMEKLADSMNINVYGVHWTTRAFLPLLRKGQLKKVVSFGTTLSSITLAPSMTFALCPAYKISKAAMEALMVQYALDHEKEGFSFIIVCPGWLQTDLGGGDMADLTAEEGAKASLDIILKPGQEYNGKMPKVFVEGWENGKPGKRNVYDGSNVPW